MTQASMRKALAVLSLRGVLLCGLMHAADSRVKGLAEHSPSDLPPVLERIIRDMDKLSREERTELFPEVASILKSLPTITGKEPERLSEEQRRGIGILNQGVAVLGQLSLEGDARASDLLAAMQQGADYWGRIFAGSAIEFAAANSKPPVKRDQGNSVLPFAAFHCELERAVADTSLPLERRILALSDALTKNFSLYRKESRAGNRRALLLLLRECQRAEEQAVIREMTLELYIGLASTDESKSFLDQLIASDETPPKVKAKAEHYRALLDRN